MLWEDGGWKKTSTKSWKFWFQERTEEERFENALRIERKIRAKFGEKGASIFKLDNQDDQVSRSNKSTGDDQTFEN